MPSIRQKMKFDLLNVEQANIDTHARTAHIIDARPTRHSHPKHDDPAIDIILKMSCHFHWLHIRNSFCVEVFVGRALREWLYTVNVLCPCIVLLFSFSMTRSHCYSNVFGFSFFRCARMWLPCARSNRMRHTNMSLKVSNQYGIVHCDVAIDVLLVALKSIQMICFSSSRLVCSVAGRWSERALSRMCIDVNFRNDFPAHSNTNSKHI